MTHRNSLIALLILMIGVSGGCKTKPKPRVVITDPCAQTYEFPNSGCASIVALVENSIEPPQVPYSVMVKAVQLSPEANSVKYTDWDGWNDSLPSLSIVPLRLTRWEISEHPVDSISVIVYAWVLVYDTKFKDSIPPARIYPHIVASDSVIHTVYFAGIGSIPAIDTFRLHLRK